MDRNLLKYYAANMGYSLAEIADMLGINRCTLQRKLNGTSEFTRSEIEQVQDYLDLNPDAVMRIFFKK